MSSADHPEADAIWDAWRAAREEDPGLEPQAFCARFGRSAPEVREQLEALLAIEDETPLPSLLRVLEPGPDGRLRFAGFRLLDELGEGAAGIVFEALDERGGHPGQRVALKLLNPVVGGGRSQRDAILREARITASLDHPSIVRVLASGTEHGYAWVATELVEGRSLAGLIEVERPPEARVALALDVGLQVSEALEHAHERGVLHRDLKPANLMLGEDGRVKVLDFGLAHSAAAAFGVSRSGEAVGTPLYMAPEQLAAARDLDGRADVYALGLVLLELATGRRLIVREDVVRVLARIARGSGRFPARFYEGLPEGLATVVSRCLEPRRRDRYASATELREDLARVREGRPPLMARMGAAKRLQRWVERRPLGVAGISLGIASLVWGGLAAWRLQRVSISVDTTMSRPPSATLDGGSIPAVFPYSTDVHLGDHELEVVDQGRHYVAEFKVEERGPRSFRIPFGPLAGAKNTRFLGELPADGRVVAWQLTARAEDQELGAPELAVHVRCPGWIDEVFRGPHSFVVPDDGVRRTLSLEAPGYRSRRVPLLFLDGRTRSLEAVLDREDSPWHTLLVGSPLHPGLERRIFEVENLALRQEVSGEKQRIGLGVVDPEREGRLHFTLELPVSEVLALAVVDVADPLVLDARHPGQGLLLSMGPSASTLSPVFAWYWPGPEGEGLHGVLDARDMEPVVQAFRESSSRELHVEYRVQGEAVWALRSSSLPVQRDDGRLRWDPALVVKVSADPDAALPRHAPLEARSLPPAERVVDLADASELLTFARDSAGGLVPFDGELVSAVIRTGRDLSGDGTDDYVVRVGDEDALHLLDGRTGAELRVLRGARGDGFGASFDLVPDLDGDGRAELLVGAIQEGRSGSSPGYVRLISGGTGETLGEREGVLRAQQYGHALAYLGELPVAGGHAALVSTYEYPIGGWGHAELLTLPGLDVLRTWKGAGADDHLGNTCAALGDVDADGVPDFALAAYNEDRLYWDDGVVRVYSGATGELLQKLSGDLAWAWLGRDLLGLGDVDGDGHADWMARQDERGEPRGQTHLLISGRTGEVLRHFQLKGRGQSPTRVGDLDGDGVEEVALYGSLGAGAEEPGALVVSPSTGRVLIGFLSGSPGVAPALAKSTLNKGGLIVGVGRAAGDPLPRLVLARER